MIIIKEKIFYLLLITCLNLVSALQDNDNKSLLAQLDRLDKEMSEAEETKHKPKIAKQNTEDDCQFVNATFCGDIIKYKVPEAQAKFPMLSDGLANANLDMTYIATKGKVRLCDRGLKEVLCRNQFAKCSMESKDVSWPGQHLRCTKLIGNCPEETRGFFEQNDLCNKMNTGKKPLDECVKPIVTDDLTHCKLDSSDHVSPWLRSAPIQIDGILDVQFHAYDTSKECQSALSTYMCSMGKECWKKSRVQQNIKRYHELCMEANKACAKDHFGPAMTELFLNCQKIKELIRENE